MTESPDARQTAEETEWFPARELVDAMKAEGLELQVEQTGGGTATFSCRAKAATPSRSAPDHSAGRTHWNPGSPRLSCTTARTITTRPTNRWSSPPTKRRPSRREHRWRTSPKKSPPTSVDSTPTRFRQGPTAAHRRWWAVRLVWAGGPPRVAAWVGGCRRRTAIPAGARDCSSSARGKPDLSLAREEPRGPGRSMLAGLALVSAALQPVTGRPLRKLRGRLLGPVPASQSSAVPGPVVSTTFFGCCPSDSMCPLHPV